MKKIKDEIYTEYVDSVKKTSAFKRLFAKTQVITRPKEKSVKNRGTHSLEVAEISRNIAHALGLNPFLAEAIGIAHDLGHTPFGHLGERALDNYFGGEFKHAKFGSFLVQNIEKLNFTPEIIQGIENHSCGYDDLKILEKNSEEGNIVRYADKIGFIFSDYEDVFEKEKIFEKSEFPELRKLIEYLGKKKSRRREIIISAFIAESQKKGKVSFSDCAEALLFQDIKRKMYNVYKKIDEEKQRVDLMNLSHKVMNKINFSNYQNFIFGKILFAILTDEEVFSIASGTDIKKTCIEEVFPIKEIKKRQNYLIFH